MKILTKNHQFHGFQLTLELVIAAQLDFHSIYIFSKLHRQIIQNEVKDYNALFENLRTKMELLTTLICLMKIKYSKCDIVYIQFPLSNFVVYTRKN